MAVGERFDWQQIRDRYPDRWVVLVDHDWDPVVRSTYTTARVLAHGSTRAEALANAQPALDAYDGYGCRYTGTIHGPMFQYKQFALHR